MVYARPSEALQFSFNAEKQRGREAEVGLKWSLHNLNLQVIGMLSGSGAEPQL